MQFVARFFGMHSHWGRGKQGLPHHMQHANNTKMKGSYGVGLCTWIRNGPPWIEMYSNSLMSSKRRHVSRSANHNVSNSTHLWECPGSPCPCARLSFCLAKLRSLYSHINSLCCRLGTSTKWPESNWRWWVGHTTRNILELRPRTWEIAASHNRLGSHRRLS